MNFSEMEKNEQQYGELKAAEKNAEGMYKQSFNDFIKFVTMGLVTGVVGVATPIAAHYYQLELGPVAAVMGGLFLVGFKSFQTAFEAVTGVENSQAKLDSIREQVITLRTEATENGAPILTGAAGMMDRNDLKERIEEMRTQREKLALSERAIASLRP